MAWTYIQYEYPVPYNFEKFLIWASADFDCYFGLKDRNTDSWTYYSGNASHGLDTGQELISYGTNEANAQTNYLTTSRDSAGKILAVLPSLFIARYVRLYVDDTGTAQIREFRPSTKLIADEILTGTLEITDQFNSPPAIKMVVSGQERIFAGDLGSNVYGFRGRDSVGNVIFELGSNSDIPYVSNYADYRAIELELMKMNFQQISWAQFAIWDSFESESKRASPDPSTYDARVYRSYLDNGDDTTPGRNFGFVSQTYTEITVVETGTSTSVGSGFLEDTNKSWFADEVRSLTLIDSAVTSFAVNSNDSDTVYVTGTPASGAYKLKDANPAYAVAFCTYLDSTNGGDGYVKLEVSFDNGSNYQTFLDTEGGVNFLGGTVLIANPGDTYIGRLTLKNDGSGNGAIIYKFLVCTDPSPWRW
jgi:hypothetical protein